MMNWMFRCQVVLLAGLLPLAMIGCGSKTAPAPNLPPELSEEEHAHAHPDNFPDAMAQLTTFKAEIEKAFESGDPESAHDSLHEIGHVLEELPTLAGKITTNAEVKASVQEATDKLFDAYGKLDDSMHGGEAVEYSSLKGDIDGAMATLATVKADEAAPVAETPAAEAAPAVDAPAAAEAPASE